MTEGGSWVPRKPAELLAAQERAVAAFTRSVEARLVAATETVVSGNREHQLDARRRLEVLRRQQDALVTESRERLSWASSQPRVVIAHRSAWLVTRTTTGLASEGATVVAAVDDGATAVSALLLEQPDLVLVEDKLPSLSGLEVLEAAAEYAPDVLVAAQLDDGAHARRYLDSGAAAVFSRRVPPAKIAAALVQLLTVPQGRPIVAL